MLPELSGIEVCRIIRAESGVPIVMLTAKDSELDKVVGLELGADDYVTKPFSLRELIRPDPGPVPAVRAGRRAGRRAGTVVDLGRGPGRPRRPPPAARRRCGRRSSRRRSSCSRSSSATRARSSPATSCSSRSGATTTPARRGRSTSTSTGCADRSRTTPASPAVHPHGPRRRLRLPPPGLSAGPSWPPGRLPTVSTRRDHASLIRRDDARPMPIVVRRRHVTCRAVGPVSSGSTGPVADGLATTAVGPPVPHPIRATSWPGSRSISSVRTAEPADLPHRWTTTAFGLEVDRTRAQLAPIRSRAGLIDAPSAGRPRSRSPGGARFTGLPAGPVRVAYAIRWLELGDGRARRSWSSIIAGPVDLVASALDGAGARHRRIRGRARSRRRRRPPRGPTRGSSGSRRSRCCRRRPSGPPTAGRSSRRP